MNFSQLADVAHIIQVIRQQRVVDVDSFYFGHSDAVERLHRLDVVATEIEIVKAIELYLLNQAEDLLVEEAS